MDDVGLSVGLEVVIGLVVLGGRLLGETGRFETVVVMVGFLVMIVMGLEVDGFAMVVVLVVVGLRVVLVVVVVVAFRGGNLVGGGFLSLNNVEVMVGLMETVVGRFVIGVPIVGEIF